MDNKSFTLYEPEDLFLIIDWCRCISCKKEFYYDILTCEMCDLFIKAGIHRILNEFFSSTGQLTYWTCLRIPDKYNSSVILRSYLPAAKEQQVEIRKAVLCYTESLLNFMALLT